MTTERTIIAELPKNARERVRVTLDTFRGTRLLDVRVFFDFGAGSVRPSDEGAFKPTCKGISIRADRISDLAHALRQAEAEARRLGWIEG